MLVNIPLSIEEVTEFEPASFSIFASDLGLRPGQFATEFTTTLGNGLNFVLARKDENCAVYEQVAGCAILLVYNT